jgi:hydroxymethylglutaryl-CoA lyase
MSFEIIECPRDAMQGLKNFIPTENKISYIKKLLHVVLLVKN